VADRLGMNESRINPESGKNPENFDTPETVLESHLETLLEKHTIYIGEGKEGMVVRLDLNDDPEMQELAHIEAGEPDKNKALKILKLYRPGQAKREYDRHLAGYQAIQNLTPEEQKLYAHIPEPIMHGDINLSASSQKHLENLHFTSKLDRAEVILMDYVQGNDLATTFYRWVHSNPPKGYDSIAKTVNVNNFEDLRDFTSVALQFSRPGGKGGNDLDRQIEAHRVFRDNANRLYKYLDHTGFTLDEEIVKKIERTEKLIKEKGGGHPDQHERNYMISGNGQDQVITIIDFGDTIEAEDGTRMEFSIGHQLRRLVKSENGESRQVIELERELQTFLVSQKFEEKFRQIISNFEGKATQEQMQILSNFGAGAVSSEASTMEFTALLYRLEDEGYIMSNQAIEQLEEVKQSLVRKGRGKSKIINQRTYTLLENNKKLF